MKYTIKNDVINITQNVLGLHPFASLFVAHTSHEATTNAFHFVNYASLRPLLCPPAVTLELFSLQHHQGWSIPSNAPRRRQPKRKEEAPGGA